MLKKFICNQSTTQKGEEVAEPLSSYRAILFLSALVKGTASRWCELVTVWCLNIVLANIFGEERYLRIAMGGETMEDIYPTGLSSRVRGWYGQGLCRNDYRLGTLPENYLKYLDEDFVRELNLNVNHSTSLSVDPLHNDRIVQLNGDFAFIDPFKLFFRSGRCANKLSYLQQGLRRLQEFGHWTSTVTYKGYTSYFLSSRSWDAETAFEISRQGRSVGCAELPSRYIAIIPRRLVDLLRNENGDEDEDLQLHQDDGVSIVDGDGVSVRHVNGELIRSGDGDFVISGPKDACPPRKISKWIEDDCVQNADILCATGGMWTYCDDSSDEEDEDEWMKCAEDDF